MPSIILSSTSPTQLQVCNNILKTLPLPPCTRVFDIGRESERAEKMERQEEMGRELVLFPLPFQGHINPMLHLATILHTKGFSITVVHTHFNAPNPSNHPDFTFLPIPNTDISEEEDVLDIVISLNTNCRAPQHELLAPKAANGEIICIIYDTLMHCVDVVANDLKLPSIPFRSNSAAHAITHFACTQLEKEGYLPLEDSVSLDLVPGFHPLRFKDLPIFNYQNVDGFLRLVAKIRSIKYPSAMISNTMEFMEQSTIATYQQRIQIPIFTLGPLHKFAPASSSSLLEEDISCISWLDKQKPISVLYVSLGSLASMDEKELTEMAWGLANSGQPFLWVVRPGSIPGSEWIEFLPHGFVKTVGERGCIVKWAPQKKVLAHSAIGGFWSHCGWNSTLESLCEGVPIICWPYFLDQRVNARYLSQVWCLGIHYEGELERGEVEEVVRRMMVDEEGNKMRQRATEFKEKAEQCIRAGGSSYESLNKLAKLITML